MVEVSVIIPSFNRGGVLGKCLAALAGQDFPATAYEIIVVDDGSTDATRDIVFSYAGRLPVVRYLRQEKRGPAAARNLAIGQARGEILLFTGDDIIAPPGFIGSHAAFHRRLPDARQALLGKVIWDPGMEATAFMRWLEKSDLQFAFARLAPGEVDPAEYFYTANLSVKKSFMAENAILFDEDFPFAAFEDIEAGRRLKAAGLALHYDDRVCAWHSHFTSFESACLRMRRAGESREMLASKSGEPAVEAMGFFRESASRVKAAVMYGIARFLERRESDGSVFRYVLEYHFRQGRRGWRRRKAAR